MPLEMKSARGGRDDALLLLMAVGGGAGLRASAHSLRILIGQVLR